jgi:hypothetical protein
MEIDTTPLRLAHHIPIVVYYGRAAYVEKVINVGNFVEINIHDIKEASSEELIKLLYDITTDASPIETIYGESFNECELDELEEWLAERDRDLQDELLQHLELLINFNLC